LKTNTFVLSRVYQDYVEVSPQKTLAKNNVVWDVLITSQARKLWNSMKNTVTTMMLSN